MGSLIEERGKRTLISAPLPRVLARIIHDGSSRNRAVASRSTHCTKRSNGSPACRREGGRRTGDPLLCRVQRVDSTLTD